MSARLIYVMDPMCSWCWGFAPVVEALAAQAAAAGVQTHLVVGGLRRERLALAASSRAKILGHWEAVNQATGQAFSFTDAMPEGFVYDSSLACRALVAARTLDATLALALLTAIQHAFYCEQRDVTNSHELVTLAQQVGLPRQAFAATFDQAEVEQATLDDFDWAQSLGIAGFPTLLAERDGQFALLTNGYQPLAALAPLLERWLARSAHA
jgi:putative protein-disulfide isomerase